MICDDFGKALQGLGFTDTVRAGEMEIRGESSSENPRVINGRIKISHFIVKDLPVLALLLNATSPFGIIGLMTDSVDFDRLTGNFQWEGDKVRLDHVNASGSAIGINIEGNTNLSSGAANLSGTIVPFSMVNRLLGYIPIIGDLITGGKGQGFLAVAYKINGNLSNPNISVNPISLLTPDLSVIYSLVATTTMWMRSRMPRVKQRPPRPQWLIRAMNHAPRHTPISTNAD